ncbi:NAD(P)H-binding protein [Rossellomorea marisflavi]|uniref:NAD(P)-dependent oxidoreductase n=1 Tax=Rossellomorea marisflavi TaxID=189381 RepID=UPI00285326E1|nr:NAD(P)H-binding protein [Rossellomorea marisflavi]MDR4937603.1 NAD(P)H-binding protein [Rossellomorea marisflavi]
MNTALFGSTGRVGSIIADQLGQKANRLVRTPTGNGVEIKGNVLNQKDIDLVLEGRDAVISTLNTDKTDVLSRSMPLILNGMRRHGIKRIITCGTAGILDASHSTGLYRFQSDESKRRSTTAAEDHLSAYLMLKASEMEWTIVCPTYLPDGERTGVFRTSEQVLPEGGRSISTHDTADYMLKVLDEGLHIRKRVGICY